MVETGLRGDLCSPEEEQPAGECVLSDHRLLATATTGTGGILSLWGNSPAWFLHPRPPWARMGKDTGGRETDLDLGRESHPSTLPQPELPLARSFRINGLMRSLQPHPVKPISLIGNFTNEETVYMRIVK